MNPLETKLFCWPDKLSKWQDHYPIDLNNQLDPAACWKRLPSYYLSFLSRNQILAALQVITLPRDLKELILEKIINLIIQDDIQALFLDDHALDWERDYYSGYYSEDSG